jgi:RHS repeat-associated protein
LLMQTDQATLNNQPSTHFYSYDGNGNVTALVNAADGTVSANYEYGPFGEVIRASGPMAVANGFQFSTKRCDATTDFLLYEYRVLRTDIGRWLSRDPIEEDGGLNIYTFVGNNAKKYIDTDGRQFREPLMSEVLCKYNLAFELVPKNEFTRGERLSTVGSTFVSNSEEMISTIDGMVPKFDPEGDCCKGACISHLSISHHGDGAGTVVLSTDAMEKFSIREEYDYNTDLNRGKTLTQTQIENLLRNEAALATLWQLGKKLCHGAKVSIVQCGSEFTPGPNRYGTLKSRLQTHFGSSVTIETFDGECGLRFGKPTTILVR